jgi:actin-related protein
MHTVIADSVEACDPGVRRRLRSHIVLCGGNSAFPGLGARLKRELSKLWPGWPANVEHAAATNLFACGERARALRLDPRARQRVATFAKCSALPDFDPTRVEYAAWIGASMLACEPPTLRASSVTKEEYDETGPSIVHRL